MHGTGRVKIQRRNILDYEARNFSTFASNFGISFFVPYFDEKNLVLSCLILFRHSAINRYFQSKFCEVLIISD